MAIVQAVKDGKVVDQDTDSSAKKAKDNEMGQDMFLQLLVAQMQYQDPLEPTSNTEWVAQMATFSMVESLNGMKESMAEQSANDLVGKYVILNTTTGDGDVTYVKGKVDYVTKVNGETKLSVNDQLYGLDTLDTVADEEYYNGSVLANELHQMIQLLPSEDNLTAFDDGLVKSAREAYEELTAAQKEFVSEDDLKKLTTLETRMNSLKATRFTGMVRNLPSVKEVQEADAETLAEYSKSLTEALEYYENMTDAQKRNVAEDTVKSLHTIEEAVKKAEEAVKPPEDDSANTESDVSELLKKILEEIQGQNKTPAADEAAGQDDSSEEAPQEPDEGGVSA